MTTIVRIILAVIVLQTSLVAKANESWSLADLMQTMAQINSFKAGFEEIKDFAFFTDAVKVSGSLSYTKPSYLKREVTSPHQEVTIIKDDIISIERERTGENDNTQNQQLSIDVHPAVRTLIESIRATFAGDLKVLQKYYQLTFGGNENAWQLVLHPLQDQVAEYVRQVEIFGSGREVNKIITIEADDSESEITIVDIVFN